MHLVWSMKAATHSGKSHSNMYLLKKTLHTRHSDMFQPWSICVEKEILLFCSDD